MYFDELNKYLSIIQNKLLLNNNICKLLHNVDKDYSVKEITENDKETILAENIHAFNFVPSTEISEKCMINIVIDDLRPAKCTNGDEHSYIKIGNVYFIVICHKNLWQTVDGLRPLLILSEIDKMFNKKYNKSEQNQIGWNGLANEGANAIWNTSNSDYTGYSVKYSTFTM